MHHQDCVFTRSDKTKEEFEDNFLHWVETDVLSLDRMVAETRHDPVQSRITSRIRKTIWWNCSRTEKPYKEIRHKLTIEHRRICNGNLIILPETQWKLVIESVHDDVHWSSGHIKRIKLEARWPGYSQDVEEFIKSYKKCKG